MVFKFKFFFSPVVLRLIVFRFEFEIENYFQALIFCTSDNFYRFSFALVVIDLYWIANFDFSLSTSLEIKRSDLNSSEDVKWGLGNADEINWSKPCNKIIVSGCNSDGQVVNECLLPRSPPEKKVTLKEMGCEEHNKLINVQYPRLRFVSMFFFFCFFEKRGADKF